MAIYTLKSNILVYFSHLNHFLTSLYICSPFRIKLLFGTPSKLLSKMRLIRDISLALQTYLLWTPHP